MFTLEKWQEKMLKEIYQVFFIYDIDIIEQSFKELCQPILDLVNSKNYRIRCEFKGFGEKNNKNNIVSFRLAQWLYQLEVDLTKIATLKLTVFLGMDKDIKNLGKICSAEYAIDTEKYTQKYEVVIDNEEIYKKSIGHDKKLIEHDSIESQKIIIKEKKYDNFIFYKDTYKTIINNLMNIVETGTFEGKCIFEIIQWMNQ